MTEINYADDYKAEKHLRKLAGMSMQEQDKLRKERKHKQKERLAIMARMDELEKERCEKCDKQTTTTIQCNCRAAKAIRSLGERLLNLSDAEPEKILKREGEVKPTLSVDEYNAMKLKGKSDREIMKEIRWSTVRFYEWKKANGLTERAPTVPTRTSLKGKPLNSMTIADYQAYKTDKLSDTKIAEKIGVAHHVLQQWKRDNDLTKSHDAAQQPKRTKGDETVTKEQSARETVTQEKYDKVVTRLETMKLKFNSAAKDYSDLKMESLEYRKRIEELESENDDLRLKNAEVEGLGKSVIDAGEVIGRKNTEIKRLTDKVAELEESLSQSEHVSTVTEQQQEIWKLAQENERLKKYEADYRNLERDYQTLHRQHQRLKQSAELVVPLMRQHISFVEQLDEVMG